MKRITINRNSKLKLLVYGKPGSGKTHFCGSLGLDERTTPVLHIDVAGNPITLHKGLAKGAAIDVLQPEKLSDLNLVYDWLAAGQPLDKHLAKKFELTRQYKSLVFDGITGIQRDSFTETMGTADHGFADFFPKREYKHYGAVLQQMIHMAKLLYALDLHCVVTAQDHTQTRYTVPGDFSTAFEYHYPLLEGEGKVEFPGYALAVIRLVPIATDVAKGKQLQAKYNYGSTEHNRYQYGKDQHGFGIEAGLADPTAAKLLDLLEEKR